MVAPIENSENVSYYLMRCTERKMKLLEDYDDKGFIYERGSIILKGYFFQEKHQTATDVHFKDYQPYVICCQYSHLICAAHIKLTKVKSNKKFKARRWRMSKGDHERIIEDNIPLQSYF